MATTWSSERARVAALTRHHRDDPARLAYARASLRLARAEHTLRTLCRDLAPSDRVHLRNVLDEIEDEQ